MSAGLWPLHLGQYPVSHKGRKAFKADPELCVSTSHFLFILASRRCPRFLTTPERTNPVIRHNKGLYGCKLSCIPIFSAIRTMFSAFWITKVITYMINHNPTLTSPLSGLWATPLHTAKFSMPVGFSYLPNQARKRLDEEKPTKKRNKRWEIESSSQDVDLSLCSISTLSRFFTSLQPKDIQDENQSISISGLIRDFYLLRRPFKLSSCHADMVLPHTNHSKWR